MKIEVKKSSITAVTAQAIIVPVFEGTEPAGVVAETIDAKCNGLVSAIRKTGDFEGKLYQTSVVYTHDAIPAGRILLAGMGKTQRTDSGPSPGRLCQGGAARAVAETQKRSSIGGCRPLRFSPVRCGGGDGRRGAPGPVSVYAL